MSTNRDVSRIVRSWLNEDRHEDADRVLDTVLVQLDTTPQRRTLWSAWRFPIMNNVLRVGLVAAAAVIIAVIAINLLPGAPAPGSEPTPTPEPTSTPIPSPSAVDFTEYPSGTALTPGSYVFTHLDPLRITFTVPAGWEKGLIDWVVWSVEDTKATLAVVSVDNLYVDPCQPKLGLRDPALGPTVDDLTTALGSVPGWDFEAPTAVSLAGFSGQQVDRLPRMAAGECDEALLWAVNGGTDSQPAPGPGDYWRSWILDIDGTRLVIVAVLPPDIPSATEAALDQIIDSIRIE